MINTSFSSTRSGNRGCGGSVSGDESKLNLLVRYLDHAVDDGQLRTFFAVYGEVTSSMVMRDIFTGESRGFGFVRFARHADALAAMLDADGKRIGAKTVNVLWAKQQHDMTPAGQERLKMTKLFLRNVPADVTEAQLSALLSHFGDVANASIHNDKILAAQNAPVRRIAFITFNTEGAAEAALRGVHNTCPFLSCEGIPLMAKLSEDYKMKTLPTLTGVAAAVPQLALVAPTATIRTTTGPAGAAALSYSMPLEAPTRTPVKLADGLPGFAASTPNSAAARSPGVSSLVPSVESLTNELVVAPVLHRSAADHHRRCSGQPDMDGSSKSSSYLSLSTPNRSTPPRTPTSGSSRTFRHNPYSAAQVVPAALLPAGSRVVLSPADSPTTVHCKSRRLSQ